MRRSALLLLLIACKDEKPPITVAPEEAAAPIAPAQTATTAVEDEVEEEEQKRPRVPVAGEGRAKAARSGILAQRKQLKERVRSLEARVSKLEQTLKVTGPRNDQRDVLAELGRSRGELAKMRTIQERCERAFDGDEWSEIEAAWLLAEDLAAEGEAEPAAENYQRFIALVADFRSHCAALEPIKGAR